MSDFDESGLTPLTPQQQHEMSSMVDLDARLFSIHAELWQMAQAIETLDDEDVSAVLGAAIRAAYVKGYNDAAQELQEQLQQQRRRQTAFQW